jgi:hypothetical protein
MYAGENDGWMVTGHAVYLPSSAANNPNGALGRTADEMARSWVFAPITENGDDRRNSPTVEYEKNGIEAGQLWPYIKSMNSYHCPADKRASRNDVGYRSYSMVAGVGAFYPPCMDSDQDLHKIHNITTPSIKYITVEEAEKNWWNVGSWAINIRDNYWYDPIAGWHSWGSTLGFADGHAEKKKWEDNRTRQWLQGDAAKQSPSIDHNNPARNPDMEYILRNFPYKKK